MRIENIKISVFHISGFCVRYRFFVHKQPQAVHCGNADLLRHAVLNSFLLDTDIDDPGCIIRQRQIAVRLQEQKYNDQDHIACRSFQIFH